MKTVNKVTIIGEVVKGPILGKTEKGLDACTFHLLTDREWFVNDVKSIETESHVCVAWDGLATVANKILGLGDRVYVFGRMANHKFITPRGVEVRETRVVVEEILLLKKGELHD